MHDDQLDISAAQVERMVGRQFPRWGTLPVRPVPSTGTVNALFRLGEELLVRLPFQPRPSAEVRADVTAEMTNARWLGQRVSIPVPQPVVLGEPDREYPMNWAVYRWLPGEPATPATADTVAVARSVAGFVRELRSVDTGGRTFQGTWRGGRLMDHDAGVQAALARSGHLIDTGLVGTLWSDLRETPRLDEPDGWTHGDLMPGNLLVSGDGLTAVIGVGGVAVRDPAVDLAPAWNLFSKPRRAIFRAELQVPQDMWDRGRAWSLVQAIHALHYYVDTNPSMSVTAQRTLAALIGHPSQ